MDMLVGIVLIYHWLCLLVYVQPIFRVQINISDLPQKIFTNLAIINGDGGMKEVPQLGQSHPQKWECQLAISMVWQYVSGPKLRAARSVANICNAKRSNVGIHKLFGLVRNGVPHCQELFYFQLQDKMLLFLLLLSDSPAAYRDQNYQPPKMV